MGSSVQKLTVEEAGRRLRAGPDPRSAPTARLRKRAATAVVLRDSPEGPELLLLRRVERPGDPWSGDVACPGGWHQEEDATLQATALREATEETGLRPEDARLVGQLDDRPGWPWTRWVDFAVTPFVFEVRGDPELTPGPGEVASLRWVPLAQLADPASRERFWWRWRPKGFPFRMLFWMPRARVDDYDVWGLTFDVLRDLLGKLKG